MGLLEERRKPYVGGKKNPLENRSAIKSDKENHQKRRASKGSECEKETDGQDK